MVNMPENQIYMSIRRNNLQKKKNYERQEKENNKVLTHRK